MFPIFGNFHWCKNQKMQYFKKISKIEYFSLQNNRLNSSLKTFFDNFLLIISYKFLFPFCTMLRKTHAPKESKTAVVWKWYLRKMHLFCHNFLFMFLNKRFLDFVDGLRLFRCQFALVLINSCHFLAFLLFFSKLDHA